MLVTVIAEGLTTAEEEQRIKEIEQEIKNSTRHIPNYVRYDVTLKKLNDKYISEVVINTFGKIARGKSEGETINLAVANASESIIAGGGPPKLKKKKDKKDKKGK